MSEGSADIGQPEQQQLIQISLSQVLGALSLEHFLCKPMCLKSTICEITLGHEVFAVSIGLALFSLPIEYSYNLYWLILSSMLPET